MKILPLLLTVLFASFLHAGDPAVRLQYLPGVTLKHNCNITFSIKELQPGLNINSQAKQKIEFLTSISSDHLDIPITQPPLTLNFTLKNLSVDLVTNKVSRIFDTKNPNSLIFKQVSEIIDKPIPLHFGPGFVMENSPEIENLLKKFPLLRNLRPEFFLAQLFEPLFALAGKDLTVGTKFQHKIPNDAVSPLPSILNYQVTEINDQDISATFDGKIEQKLLSLTIPFKLNDRQEKIEVVLSGTQKGEIHWNRKNALLYNLKTNFLYSALLKIGEFDWMIHIDLEQELDSIKL